MHLEEEEDDGLTFIRPNALPPLEVVNLFFLVQNKQSFDFVSYVSKTSWS